MDGSGFRWELLYEGVSGNTVSILYREFVGADRPFLEHVFAGKADLAAAIHPTTIARLFLVPTSSWTSAARADQRQPTRRSSPLPSPQAAHHQPKMAQPGRYCCVQQRGAPVLAVDAETNLSSAGERQAMKRAAAEAAARWGTQPPPASPPPGAARPAPAAGSASPPPRTTPFLEQVFAGTADLAAATYPTAALDPTRPAQAGNSSPPPLPGKAPVSRGPRGPARPHGPQLSAAEQTRCYPLKIAVLSHRR
jgi:hypothetical protein